LFNDDGFVPQNGNGNGSVALPFAIAFVRVAVATGKMVAPMFMAIQLAADGGDNARRKTGFGV
jgi:hypothetical protein